MLRIGFWNLNNNQSAAEAACRLCLLEVLDVLIVCENASPPSVLQNMLNSQTTSHYTNYTVESQRRLQIFSMLPASRVNSVYDGPYASIKHVSPLIGDSLILVAVHLRSKTHASIGTQHLNARSIVEEIRKAERKFSHQRTIVIGDFNLNPFDPGIINADAFHAVMDRRIARTRSRRVMDSDYDFFYNPMWNLLGDASESAPGSFFYTSSQTDELFWHMLDQVLVRPSLIDRLDESQLRLINTIGDIDLRTDHGRPRKTEYSDHFPLVCTIRDHIPQGITNERKLLG